MNVARAARRRRLMRSAAATIGSAIFTVPSIAFGTLIGGQVRGFFPDVNDRNRFPSAPVTITAEEIEFESTLAFDFDADTLTIRKQNAGNLLINGGADVAFFDFVLDDPLLVIDSITVVLDEFSTGGGSATPDEIRFSCCGGIEPPGHQRVIYQFSFAIIPEPSTALLMGLGLLGFALQRGRPRKRHRFPNPPS